MFAFAQIDASDSLVDDSQQLPRSTGKLKAGSDALEIAKLPLLFDHLIVFTLRDEAIYVASIVDV